MIIQPLSSFVADSDSAATLFPSADVLFHDEDFVSGASSWTSRSGNLVATLSGAALKDSDGVYGATNLTVSSVAGTMPTPSGYCVVFCIGKVRTNSATTGADIVIGSTGGSTSTIGTSNNYTDATNADQTNAAGISGSPTTTGADVCKLSYYDCVDAVAPVSYEVLANNLNEPIGSVTDTTASGVGFDLTALSSGLTISALSGTTHAGARCKIFGILTFASELTLNELKIAAAEMARTQQLFAGWRNRA